MKQSDDAAWTWGGSLLLFERVVVIIAGLLAIFPLVTYILETDDRERDRLVRQAQLAQSCMKFSESMKIDKEPLSLDVVNTTQMSFLQLLSKCYALGMMSVVNPGSNRHPNHYSNVTMLKVAIECRKQGLPLGTVGKPPRATGFHCDRAVDDIAKRLQLQR